MTEKKLDEEKWYEEAKQNQERFSELMGRCDWDESAEDILRSRLAFAFFGLPEGCLQFDERHLIENYTKEQKETVNNVTACIIKNQPRKDSKILVSFTLITGIMKNGCCIEELVIRIPKLKIIDRHCRVYSNWSDFENNNLLPEATILYPQNGRYEFNRDKLILCSSQTPASRIKQKALKVADIGTTVTSLTTAAVLTGSLFLPVAAPIIGVCYGTLVAAAGYGIGRNADVLVDRADHQQTISLRDPGARSAWLGIATSATAVVSGAAAVASRFFVATGASISRAASIGLVVTNSTHCATTALQVVNDVAYVALKGDDITAADILQCVGSVLFFANAVVSTHQVRMVLKSLPQNNNNNFSEFVKNINQHETANDCSVRPLTVVDNASLGAAVPLSSFPFSLSDVLKKLFKFISERNLNELQKYVEEFCAEICNHVLRIWEEIKKEKEIIVKKLKQSLHYLVDKILDFKEGLDNLSYPELKRIEQVLDTFSQEENEIMHIISKIAQFEGVMNIKDIANCIVFLEKFLHEEVQKKENDFQSKLGKGKEHGLSEKDMEKICEIKGKHSEYFLRETLKQYCDDPFNFKCAKLNAKFREQKNQANQVREMVELNNTAEEFGDKVETKIFKSEELSESRMVDLIKSHVQGFEPEFDDTFYVENKQTYIVKFKNHEKFKMAFVYSFLDGLSWSGLICLVTKPTSSKIS